MATLGATASTTTFPVAPTDFPRPLVLVATLANDKATASTHTTPVDLTGLVWTYVENAVYVFRWVGTVTPGATTTGVCFTINVSGTVAQICMAHINPQSTHIVGASVADDTQLNASSGFLAATASPVCGWGMLRTTSGQSGTAQMRVRAEVDAIVTANAGTTLVVERVS